MTASAEQPIYPQHLLGKRGDKDISEFWMTTAAKDADDVLAKYRQYGSLNAHATYMLMLVGRPYASMREGTEIVLASYIAGKLTRLFEGLSRGELPNEDSWADLARYAMMARYVRKHGEWP